MRRHNVATTMKRRRFDVMCILGVFLNHLRVSSLSTKGSFESGFNDIYENDMFSYHMTSRLGVI